MNSKAASPPIPLGQIALHRLLGERLPPPFVRSFAVSGARRTRETETTREEFYPAAYQTEETLLGNLRFAFQHEPLDIGIVHAALESLDRREIEAVVRQSPFGKFSRRLWFFAEFLMGQTLDLEDIKAGNYVSALDERTHFTASSIRSPRHRVQNNLLGTSALCPTLRRTPKLEAWIQTPLRQSAQELTQSADADALARAVRYLYTKETRSTFALEGEVPSRSREERFVQALHSLSTFRYQDKEAFVRLQASIVDPRYAAQDWRTVQNFVGETTRGYGEYVHFICPRPQDVPSLMQGWMELTERLLNSPLDAVLAAAVSAFAFVFIHPFEDGNGRIHRFLVHFLLNRKEWTPPNVLFPISAAILRQKPLYDQALEAFSRPLLACIDWDFAAKQGVVVNHDTRNLYRFWDATPQAEFLFERVAETIEIDFKAELEFLRVYDAAFAAVREIVDMPDHRAALLTRLLIQNGGVLSHSKRKQFAELHDEEIEQMENALSEILRGQ